MADSRVTGEMNSDFLSYSAVLLCLGNGTRLFPLCADEALESGVYSPKCLLPVSGRPVISYSIDLLQKSGFNNIIIVTRHHSNNKIQKWINEEYKGPATLNLVQVENNYGTADALRHIHQANLIKGDVIVLSGDVITCVQLHYLADLHRSRDSCFTALLWANTNNNTSNNTNSNSNNSMDDLDTLIIGLDTSPVSSELNKITHNQWSGYGSAHRLLIYRSASDVGDSNFSVNKQLLSIHPRISISASFKDSHIYAFSYGVLSLLNERPDLQSIQTDLIPLLVKGQYNSKLMGKYRHLLSRQKDIQIDQLRASNMSHEQMLSDGLNVSSLYRCDCLVAPSTSICLRANSLNNFTSLNFTLAQDPEYSFTPWRSIKEDNQIAFVQKSNPESKVQPSCFVGSQSIKIGKDSVIKKCIIGKNCVIGANCKLSNSILFDDCVIEDSVNMVDSILAWNVVVGKSSTLKDSKVGPNYKIQAHSEIKNELLVHSNDK